VQALPLDWPLPGGVRAFCSTRSGGVSAAPWDTLNLGDHVGDEAAAVAENRRRYAHALGARPLFLQQVHGTGVERLDPQATDGTVADACWTMERGIACTIIVADCLPILFAAEGVVAAAHAGWRGLAAGVLEALWENFWPEVADTPQRAATATTVWLGPCIGPDAFEVGPEVKAAFEAAQPAAARRFRQGAPGKWLADLPNLARDRLSALGLAGVHGNDGGTAWCTVSDPSRFFSHRRDRRSGRFAASIWLV